MKIVLFANSAFATPGFQVLLGQRLLAGLVVARPTNYETNQMAAMAKQAGVPVLVAEKERFAKTIDPWLNKIGAEVALVLTFPFKIPNRTLGRLQHGFFNFHFARLPQYRGSNPVIWEIINQEPHGAVSIHKMDSGWDTGPLVKVHPVSLDSEDNFASFQTKLAQTGGQLIVPLLQQILAGGPTLTDQDANSAKYWSKPGIQDMLIRWPSMDRAAIRALVKAGNPWNKGAMTLIRGFSIKIVETTTVELDVDGANPGTILNTPTDQGLVVACKEGTALRVDMVYLDDQGFLTGNRFLQMGVQAGEQFHLP